jgi:molecular chaperone GrpE
MYEVRKHISFNRFSNALLNEQEKSKLNLINNIDKNKNKFLLLYSDFENFRKRKNEEISVILKNANKDLIYNILIVLDDFEGAIDSVKTNIQKSSALESDLNGIHSGLLLIMKNLLKKLEHYGLKPLKSLGMPFNPNLHEAIKHVNDESLEEDVVVKEYQRGYMLNKNLLRPSKVVVNIRK